MSTEITTDDQDQTSAEPKSTDPDEIEAKIEADRAELAKTVDALSAKLDVKSQAQERAAEVKAKAQTTMQDPDARADALKQAAPVLAGIAAVAVLIGVLRRVAHK